MHIEVIGRHFAITRSLVAQAGERLGHALDRFADRVGRVTMRLADINGPRGGEGIQALAVAHLEGGGQLVVRGSYSDPRHAVNDLSGRLGALVRRRHSRAVSAAHGR